MSWVAVVVGGVALVSSLAQSNAAEAQSEQDSAVANNNASQSIANMQAVEAQSSAQEEATRSNSAQYLGRQRAAMADSGTGSLGSGSNFDVGQQSAVAAEMDALNVRYAGQLKGEDQLQQAYNFKYGAAASQAQADSIGSTKYMTAGAAALSSAASSYGRGMRTRAGTPGTGTNTYGGISGGLN